MINNTSILTYTGNYFDLANPENSYYCIRDIAHALSLLCRYTGHCESLYSVAQHSLLASQLVPEEFALHALLHDGTEAYLSDINSPLKNLLPQYKTLEQRHERALFSQFGLPPKIPDAVKQVDRKLLITEQRDLMNNDDEWPGFEGVEPYDFTIVPQSSYIIELKFLSRYKEIIG